MSTVGIVGFITLCFILYKKEKYLEHILMEHSFIKKAIVFIAILLISLLFTTQLNLSPTNVFFDNANIVDSSVFLYIGKSMLNGMLPYKDLFDHKGIILYFIEYLGFVVGFGNSVGVWIIELLNIMLTSFFLFKIACEFSKSKTICLLSVYIVLQFCSLGYFEGGNFVEEYALPWIALSLYYVVRFLKNKSYKNWEIIIIGSCFAIVFFLRVNMVGLWAPLVFCVLIEFINAKKYVDILKCIVFFVLGCFIIVIPIYVYLILSRSFNEMIECYFKFNFSYTSSEFGIKQLLIFFDDCISFSGIAAGFIIFSVLAQPQKKFLIINYFGLFVAFLSSAISGRSYMHYCIIFIPFFIIPAVLTINTIMEKVKSDINIPKSKAIVLIIIAFCLIGTMIYPTYGFYNKKTNASDNNEVVEYLVKSTQSEDDVLILGNSVAYYLESDRSTKNKFFYQFPPVTVSDKLYDEFIKELNDSPSDYIVRFGSHEGNENWARINDYLNEKCKNGVYVFEEHNSFEVYIKDKKGL
jgi:hypothetical protein